MRLLIVLSLILFSSVSWAKDGYKKKVQADGDVVVEITKTVPQQVVRENISLENLYHKKRIQQNQIDGLEAQLAEAEDQLEKINAAIAEGEK